MLRHLSGAGLADFREVEAAPFWEQLQQSGRVIETEWFEDAVPGSAAVLRHPRVPVITYPYEWCFAMLKDAALLTLEVTAAALESGISVKDATPYNVQFRGTDPVFIDVGSFRPLPPGEPWPGYQQFCQQFLYPLMLQAHRGVDARAWLRGSLNGIAPDQMARLVSVRDRVRPSVLKHVVLHARLQRGAARRSTNAVREDLQRAGFSRELIAANLRGLTKLVTRLDWQPRRSEWSDYRTDNSYSSDDERAKVEEVSAVVVGVEGTVWDLGANDGKYSRLAAEHASVVLALDADALAVDHLYRELRSSGNSRIVPLVMDLTDPSNALGWRGLERPALTDRARPDLVLALAVVHHLTLTHSVPVPELVAWLHDLGADVLVEIPHREDPQVQRLLSHKAPGDLHDYDLSVWRAAIDGRFRVLRERELPSGFRTLLHLSPV